MSTVTSAPELRSSVDPAAGTSLTAVTSCPAGEALLGGGGHVAATAPKKPATTKADGKSTSGSTVSTGQSTTSGAKSTSASAPTGPSGGVALESSYPVANGWRTVAVVTGALSGGQIMTLQPYVLCGKK